MQHRYACTEQQAHAEICLLAQFAAGSCQVQTRRAKHDGGRAGQGRPAPGLVQMPRSRRCLAVRAMACMAASASPSNATCAPHMPSLRPEPNMLCLSSNFCPAGAKQQAACSNFPACQALPGLLDTSRLLLTCQPASLPEPTNHGKTLTSLQGFHDRHNPQGGGTCAAPAKPPPIPRPLLSAASPWEESQAKGQ